jgi:hypothetical protein
MTGVCRLAVVSDIHYAGAAEQARGDDYEFIGVSNALFRFAGRLHRRFVWLHRPLHQGYLLQRFLKEPDRHDYVIANGDFTCNTAFIGVSDEAACQSAEECLRELRAKFGGRLRATIGDHELGKTSLFGHQGGMRLASWESVRSRLGLQPFWRVEIGRYVLIGVASSLVALPALGPDLLPEEQDGWHRLRETHMGQIREAFAALTEDQRVLLFCHDPTALPFLGREQTIRARLPQLARTVIGHLHSRLVLGTARVLAGLPSIKWLGPTGHRISAALGQAREWRPFRLQLCPALAGIQLLNDGGYLTAELDLEARKAITFQFHPLPR